MYRRATAEGEVGRNSKALSSWIGIKKIEFLYDRDLRVAGKTRWNCRKLIRPAIDGIISFTTMPLRLAIHCGVLTLLAAIICVIVIIVRTLVRGIDVSGRGGGPAAPKNPAAEPGHYR